MSDRKVTVNVSGEEEKVSNKLSIWQSVICMVYSMADVAAFQDQERSHLLFPKCWKSERGLVSEPQ